MLFKRKECKKIYFSVHLKKPLELPSFTHPSLKVKSPAACHRIAWAFFFLHSLTTVATKQYSLSFFIRVCVNGKFENLWVYRMCTSLFFYNVCVVKQVRMSEMVVCVRNRQNVFFFYFYFIFLFILKKKNTKVIRKLQGNKIVLFVME